MIGEVKRIAQIEFEDIVTFVEITGCKLRIYLTDGSFIDVYISQSIPGRFGFHWERKHINGKIYRYDNYPNSKWRGIQSFPYHFHNGSDEDTIESTFSRDILSGFRDFMNFARDKLGH